MNEFNELREAAQKALKKMSIAAIKSAEALKKSTEATRELMRIRETEETMKARNDAIDARNYAIDALAQMSFAQTSFMYNFMTPNKRVKHLALHSKKARVRKKQYSRMEKYSERARKLVCNNEAN